MSFSVPLAMRMHRGHSPQASVGCRCLQTRYCAKAMANASPPVPSCVSSRRAWGSLSDSTSRHKYFFAEDAPRMSENFMAMCFRREC